MLKTDKKPKKWEQNAFTHILFFLILCCFFSFVSAADLPANSVQSQGNEITGKLDPCYPMPAPENFTAKATEKGVLLTWKKPLHAELWPTITRYKIYRLDAINEGPQWSIVGPDVFSFLDTNVTYGDYYNPRIYRYQITAVNDYSEGDPQYLLASVSLQKAWQPGTTPPQQNEKSRPKDPSCCLNLQDTDSGVLLRWLPPEDESSNPLSNYNPVAYYRIYRSSSPYNNFKPIAVVGSNVREHEDAFMPEFLPMVHPENGCGYGPFRLHYKVKAVDAEGHESLDGPMQSYDPGERLRQCYYAINHGGQCKGMISTPTTTQANVARVQLDISPSTIYKTDEPRSALIHAIPVDADNNILPRKQVQLQYSNDKGASWIDINDYLQDKVEPYKYTWAPPIGQYQVRAIVESIESNVVSFTVKDDPHSCIVPDHKWYDTLPPTFSWRDYNGKDYMTPVKAQGNCGSCSAFGAVSAIEAVHNIENKRILYLDLAEQELLSAHIDDCMDGGLLGDQLKYISDTGIVDENCIPYQSSACVYVYSYPLTRLEVIECNLQCLSLKDENGILKDYCSRPVNLDNICADTNSRKWKIKEYHGVDNSYDDTNLKQSIYCYGPIPAGGSFEGGPHAFVLVGWDDTTQSWIFKNSWGTGWNGDGYGTIPYKRDNNDGNYINEAYWITGVEKV